MRWSFARSGILSLAGHGKTDRKIKICYNCYKMRRSAVLIIQGIRWRAGTSYVRFIFKYVLHPAVQNTAQSFYRMCGDVHILFQASNLPGAEAVVFDKTILGDFFLLHGFPQFIICNQGVAPPISLNTERL